MKKIVVCIPRGGINDMLVQIEKCWRYSEIHNRILYVDSSKSGLLDNLGFYFLEPSGVKFGEASSLLSLSGLATFPKISETEELKFKSKYSSACRNFIFEYEGTQISFDFAKNYEEDVLIHEQCGGGRESLQALGKLELQPTLANEIIKKIKSLGSYDAIHVRNTDYKTDYKAFFNDLNIAGDRNIVLCSDDLMCQKYAASKWGSKLLIPNIAPQTHGKPLHMNPDLDRRKTNLAAIEDLMILASSSNIHYANIDLGRISGFTQLAIDLQSNPLIIRNLLGKL